MSRNVRAVPRPFMEASLMAVLVRSAALFSLLQQLFLGLKIIIIEATKRLEARDYSFENTIRLSAYRVDAKSRSPATFTKITKMKASPIEVYIVQQVNLRSNVARDRSCTRQSTPHNVIASAATLTMSRAIGCKQYSI